MSRKCFAAALQHGQNMAELDSGNSWALPPDLLPPHPAPPHPSLRCCGQKPLGWRRALAGAGLGLGWGYGGLGGERPASHTPPNAAVVVSQFTGVHFTQCLDGAPQELETDGQPSVPTRCRCLLGLGAEIGNPTCSTPLPSPFHFFSIRGTFGSLLDLSDLSLLICKVRLIITPDVLACREAQIAATCVNTWSGAWPVVLAQETRPCFPGRSRNQNIQDLPLWSSQTRWEADENIGRWSPENSKAKSRSRSWL